MISEEYRKLNARLHAQNADYGTSGKRYAKTVLAMVQKYQTRDILDYGCGKRTLSRELGFKINEYDPAIAGLNEPPKPADIVVCTDVMEHIEPEYLENVLDDIKRVTKTVLMVNIAVVKAVKLLEDGRNAHLIVHPIEWWLPKLRERFDIRAINGDSVEVMLICTAKK